MDTLLGISEDRQQELLRSVSEFIEKHLKAEKQVVNDTILQGAFKEIPTYSAQEAYVLGAMVVIAMDNLEKHIKHEIANEIIKQLVGVERLINGKGKKAD